MKSEPAPAPGAPPAGVPLWAKALGATLLMQAVAAFLTRVAPVIGPDLTDAAGVDAEAIGYLAAASGAGTVWALTGSASVLKRLGPLRLLQVGALIGAGGLVLTIWGWWPAMMVAAFLIGVGYAPSPPAGSDILARHAPRKHQGIVFSIKQAAVPVGGVAAGLLVPPCVLAFGWRGALVVLALGVVAIAMLVQPLQREMDAGRDPAWRVEPRWFFSLDPLIRPFRFVAAAPGLWGLTYCGFAFATVQGSLIAFLVTYLATDLAMGLALAGVAFAVMQAAGTIGRIGAGWTADRVGSNRTVLSILAATSACVILLVSRIEPGWPAAVVIVISAASGLMAVSWNGIYLAEIARTAKDHIAEATAGSGFFTFLGYTAGPALFAVVVRLSESYRLAFTLTALVPLTALAVLLATRRAARARG